MLNKKGSALMQVMVMGSVIAAIIVMLMRFSVGRTSNMLKTRRMISAKAFAEGCMAQYNAIAVDRAMRGEPITSSLTGDNIETFTCTVNGVSQSVSIKWGSTVTGLGVINDFYVDVNAIENPGASS